MALQKTSVPRSIPSVEDMALYKTPFPRLIPSFEDMALYIRHPFLGIYFLLKI